MLVVVALAFVATELAPRASGQGAAGFPTKMNGEWATYNADVRGSRYMPLDQINASNFNIVKSDVDAAGWAAATIPV